MSFNISYICRVNYIVADSCHCDSMISTCHLDLKDISQSVPVTSSELLLRRIDIAPDITQLSLWQHCHSDSITNTNFTLTQLMPL